MTKLVPVLIATVAVVALIVVNVNSTNSSQEEQFTKSLQIILDRLGEVEKRLKVKVPDNKRIVFSDEHGAQVVK